MNIYDLSYDDLAVFFLSNQEKEFRAKQVIDWIYKKRVESFDALTNMKAETIALLKQNYTFEKLSLVKDASSADGTKKFLFSLQDGNLIETVLMKYDYGYSLCVTSQIGCNMGCAFCASGLLGKVRNLTPGEMVLQILTVEKLTNIRISHVVVMGIGEPFDNYDNVMKFVKIINDQKALEIGARHITISTSGLVPKIRQYAKEGLQINLAISLHAPNNRIRDEIMKINRSYPIEELIDAVKYYIETTNRRVTFEYILLDGINDSKECALELINLIRGLNAYVNLIPYNEVTEKEFKRSKKDNMQAFFDILKKRGINVTMRREQGLDISAACGQLRAKNIHK